VTYVKAYLVLPLLFALPALGIVLGIKRTGMQSNAAVYGWGIACCVWAGYCLAIGATVLHRARGGKR
jgi:hypothetical protein